MNLVINFVGADKGEKHLREFKGKSIIALPECYIVIDIETTGLDTNYCDIIEIAAIKIINSCVVDSYNSLIKPNGFYGLDSYITELTGITEDMILNSPAPNEVIPKFKEFIGDEILIGHNVNFDINFLYDAFIDVLDEPLKNNFIDTMRISRKLFKESEHHRLCDMSKSCNVEYVGAHRALNDCNITYSCFEKMCNIILDNYSSVYDFQKLFNSNKRIDCSAITATIEEFDEDHPFYNKTVVFTGALSGVTRKDAMQSVVNVGGLISDNVTKKTNFLVIGSFDFIQSVKGDKSSKMIKAEKMRLDGYDITVISENTFIEMLENIGFSEDLHIKKITNKDKQILNTIISMLDEECLKLSSLTFRNNAENNSYNSIVVKPDATLYRGSSANEITFARVKTSGITQYIAFNKNYKQLFIDANIEYTEIQSDNNFIRVDLSLFNSKIKNLEVVSSIINKIFVSVFNFPPFGCCSKYVECSNAKKCIHEDYIYAKSCMYRKNLEQGKIFYGKNINI